MLKLYLSGRFSRIARAASVFGAWNKIKKSKLI
jgi:hypothetical protein